MRVFFEERIPGEHFGEAEEEEAGEVVSSAAAAETDSETATLPIEMGRGHEVVFIKLIHDANILKFYDAKETAILLAPFLPII